MDVTNSGKIDTDEVVQMYLDYPDSAKEPPKQLRDFRLIHLAAGETSKVGFTLTSRAVSVFDESYNSWTPVSGTFTVHIGRDSRDFVLSEKLDATACKIMNSLSVRHDL